MISPDSLPSSPPPGVPPVTIGIMGTPLSSGNRGVLALGAALTRLCLDAAPGAEAVYFGSHRDDRPVVMRPHGRDYPLRVVHWRMSPKGALRHHLFVIVAGSFLYRFLPLPALRRWLAAKIPWIGEVARARLVGDVRGGDSFSDIYGLKRLLLASLPVLSVIWIKRGIVLFPQTYGPFKSRTSRWIAQWIVRRATTVVARDKESQRIARDLARPDQEVLLSPDVAFALHADKMESALFNFQLQPQLIPKDAIGLNVNGLMFNGGYTGKNMFGLKLDYRPFLTQLATELLSLHPGPLLLVPHTYAPAGDVESDNEACRLLKESLPPALQSRVFIVTGDYDCHQLKGIIARCLFFVGSRMHSCIAALSQGVPCVGVAYSMKFRGVFESVGMADWVVDGRSADNANAVAETIRLYHARGVRQPDLARQSDAARTALHTIFNRLLRSSASN